MNKFVKGLFIAAMPFMVCGCALNQKPEVKIDKVPVGTEEVSKEMVIQESDIIKDQYGINRKVIIFDNEKGDKDYEVDMTLNYKASQQDTWTEEAREETAKFYVPVGVKSAYTINSNSAGELATCDYKYRECKLSDEYHSIKDLEFRPKTVNEEEYWMAEVESKADEKIQIPMVAILVGYDKEGNIVNTTGSVAGTIYTGIFQKAPTYEEYMQSLMVIEPHKTEQLWAQGMVEKLEADHIVGYPLIYEAKDIVERMQDVY